MQEDQVSVDQNKSRRLPRKLPLVVLCLLLIGLVLLAGWKWHSQISNYKNDIRSRDQKIADLDSKINNIGDKTTQSSSTTSQPTESKKYLEIIQWGVKLTPTASPMSYSITSLGDSEVLQLTNSDVAKLGGSCTSESYLALVSRYKTRLDESEDSTVSSYVGKINDYYYYVAGSNGMCSENPSETTIRNALVAAAKTLQAL